ncbi:oxidative-stress responsive protein 1 [Apostasia shenzhenica]|uniref:Oxidative-stress responsive protein 1 n=1 Tax=Apostasia shenzhenica TaxID=1088818 RepID=A0A2I0AD48_9ASPA|nr:oxidative-stress responsive protein 1 [Apostasia shenzhenica]
MCAAQGLKSVVFRHARAARQSRCLLFLLSLCFFLHLCVSLCFFLHLCVLLMTLQNAPPGLDYDRDKSCAQSFKEMVAMCLVKDQTKRPSAEKLLKHSFFKNAKPPDLSVKSLLVDLPPLWDRVKALQLKDAAQLALKKMPSAEQEALSQSEYQRGVSAWNFDIEDLKAQASLIQDDEGFAETKEDDGSLRHFRSKDPSTSGSIMEKSLATNEIGYRNNLGGSEASDYKSTIKIDNHLETELSDFSNQEGIDSFGKVRLKKDSVPSTSKHDPELRWKSHVGKKHQTYSGPILPMHCKSSEKWQTSERVEGESQFTDRLNRDAPKSPNISGLLMLPNRASANSLSAPIRCSGGYGDSLEDKARANVVQIKGRFSITSENVDLVKDVPLGSIPRRPSQPANHLPKDIINSLPASVLMPHLQNLFQQASFQQDLLTNLLNSLHQSDIVDAFQTGAQLETRNLENDALVDTAVTERERVLLIKISELQARMISLTDELTATRLKHIENIVIFLLLIRSSCTTHLQLQEQLNAVLSQEDGREEFDAT